MLLRELAVSNTLSCFTVLVNDAEKPHHGRDGEVSGMHLLGEPIHLPSGVDEDDCLGNGQGFIQVAQCVQLPLLSFHIDVELTDTLQRQLFLLDKNSNWVPHELLGHLKHIRRHCS